ncbi:MAG: ankyrin repeat domain-containing protein [Pseudomonadota bacterium]
MFKFFLLTTIAIVPTLVDSLAMKEIHHVDDCSHYHAMDAGGTPPPPHPLVLNHFLRPQTPPAFDYARFAHLYREYTQERPIHLPLEIINIHPVSEFNIDLLECFDHPYDSDDQNISGPFIFTHRPLPPADRHQPVDENIPPLDQITTEQQSDYQQRHVNQEFKEASKRRDIKRLTILLQGADNPLPDAETIKFSFYQATWDGNRDIVYYLIQHCDPVFFDPNAINVALNAAAFNGHVDIVKLLLIQREGISFPDRDSIQNAFNLACDYGHLACVIELLSQKHQETDIVTKAHLMREFNSLETTNATTFQNESIDLPLLTENRLSVRNYLAHCIEEKKPQWDREAAEKKVRRREEKIAREVEEKIAREVEELRLRQEQLAREEAQRRAQQALADARAGNEHDVDIHVYAYAVGDGIISYLESHFPSIEILSTEQILTRIDALIDQYYASDATKIELAKRAIRSGFEYEYDVGFKTNRYISLVLAFLAEINTSRESSSSQSSSSSSRTDHGDVYEIWLDGFIRESIDAYRTAGSNAVEGHVGQRISCAGGVNERVTMGLRHVHPDIDAICAQPESKVQIKNFINNLNFIQSSRADQVAHELIHRGIHSHSTIEEVLAAYESYLDDGIRAHGVTKQNYSSEIKSLIKDVLVFVRSEDGYEAYILPRIIIIENREIREKQDREYAESEVRDREHHKQAAEGRAMATEDQVSQNQRTADQQRIHDMQEAEDHASHLSKEALRAHHAQRLTHKVHEDQIGRAFEAEARRQSEAERLEIKAQQDAEKLRKRKEQAARNASDFTKK